MPIATARVVSRSPVLTALRSGVRSIARISIPEWLLAATVVTATLGFLVAPRLMNCFCGSRAEVAQATAKKYAGEAYVQWSQSTGLACPAHLAQLTTSMNNKDTKDPWGTEYIMRCGARVGPNNRPGIVVVSAGKDGRFGTADDIGSDRWSRK
jgi:hypothetical protein